MSSSSAVSSSKAFWVSQMGPLLLGLLSHGCTPAWCLGDRWAYPFDGVTPVTLVVGGLRCLDGVRQRDDQTDEV